MTYPVGFAQRFLHYLVDGAAAGAVLNVNFEQGWIEYADLYKDIYPNGGRVAISDSAIAPVWEHLLSESRHIYPDLSDEIAITTLLAVGIQELQDTDYRPIPRRFDIAEVTANYARPWE